MTDVRDVKTILFVPGNRPDRYGKALASGSPAIVLDLEDAVAPSEKNTARKSTLEWIAQQPRDAKVKAGVRVNQCVTRHGVQDLAALAELERRPDFIALPKVEDPFEVVLTARLLPDVPLFCLIESAIGLHRAFDIARASPSVAGLAFGGADLSADLRAEMSWDALYHARGVVVQAAASAGVAAVDVPFLNVASDDGLREECLRAKAMGYTGKFAIHPRHVATIEASFAPSQTEIERAQKVLRAAESVGGNAGRAGDSMIDEALLRSARRILANAGLTGA